MAVNIDRHFQLFSLLDSLSCSTVRKTRTWHTVLTERCQFSEGSKSLKLMLRNY